MSAAAYAASRIGKTTHRKPQSLSLHRYRSHTPPAAQQAPEPTLGPYNIWAYDEDYYDEETKNFLPTYRWIESFSSAEERNAYLAAKERRLAEYRRRVDEEKERLVAEEKRLAELQRAEEVRLAELQRAEEARLAELQRAEEARLAAEKRAAEEAENVTTAQMGCLGRSCKRGLQWLKGTHTLRGVRKPSTKGGRRHRVTRHRHRKH